MAGAGRPTRLAGGERRRQLLAVAGRLFAEHGFHGLSMEQLAEGAGVSKPVLYQHFPSKRALYLALVRDAVADMERRVHAALAGTTDNRARVEGAVAAYVEFVGDPRHRLLAASAELDDADGRTLVDDATTRLAVAVGDLIATDAGLDRAAAGLLASALRGIAVDGARWWQQEPALAHDEVVQLLTRLAWRGLGSFTPDPSLPGASASGGEASAR